MSKFLIESISPEAVEQINKLLSAVNANIEGVIRLNKEFKNLTVPSDISKGIVSVQEAQKKSNTTVNEAIKIVEKQRLSEIKLAQQREKAFDKYNSQLEREKKAREAQVNKESALRQRLEKQREGQSKKEQSRIDKEIRELERAKKARESQINKESALRERLARQRAQEEKASQRAENAKAREEAKQAKLNEAYRKASARLNELRTRYKNLAIQQELGVKLTDRQEKEMRELGREAQKLDRSLKKVDRVMGQSQRYVGEYERGLKGVKNIFTGLVGAFGIVEGLRLGKDLALDSIRLAKEAKGVEFAFARLGDVGEDAFLRVKKSTRGLLSNLDIKRSLVDFDNFNLSLEDTDVLFEFLSVRAAQTGKSVDSLKDSLVEGLSKESKLRIDNLGISASELNAELEKTPDFVEAVANIARREVAEAGDILDKTANSTEKWASASENAKVELGKLLTTGNLSALGLLSDLVEKIGGSFALVRVGLNRFRDGLSSVIKPFTDFTSKFPVLDKFLTKVTSGFSTFFKIVTTSGLEILGVALSQIGASLSGLGNAIPVAITQVKSLIDAFVLLGSILLNPIKAAQSFANGELDLVFQNLQDKTRQAGENIALAFAKGYNDALKNTEIETPEGIENSGGDTDPQNLQGKEKQIDLIKRLTDALKDQSKEYKEREALLEGIKPLENDLFLEGLELPKEKLEEIIVDLEDFNKRVAKTLRESEVRDILIEQFSGLEQTLGVEAGTFTTIFDQINNGFKDVEKSAQAFGNVATAVFANLMQASNIRLENEKANLQIEKDTALAFAGDSASAKEEIERRFDERQKAIRLKQAKNERAQALFEIGIATAVGVIKALAMTPPNIPLSIAIGAIGLAQAAVVASQPLPQFKDGVTNFEGGYAMINDQKGSSYQEAVRTPDGRVTKYAGRNLIMDLPKGSDVLTASETKAYENMLGENGINGFGDAIYNNSSVAPVVNVNSEGISKKDMEDVMRATLAKQPKNTTVWDKKGVSTFVKSGHSRKELLSSRVTFSGQSI